MVASARADIFKVSQLAGPLILTNLLYVAIATIDLIMLGMLSPLELAAGGLAIGIFNQFRTMGTGVVTATGNLVSDAIGKAKLDQITSLFNASMLIGTFLGLLFAAAMFAIEPFLRFIGTSEAIANLTTQYLTVIALGLLPCFWFQSVRHFSVGLKRPGPLMLITGVSVVLTIVLNYGLIFGQFGLPQLGFVGVAAATCIVLYLSFLLFILFAKRDDVLSPYLTIKFWQTDREALSKTWKMGVPIGATYGLEAGFFTVLALFVATLGVNALAAHNVVSQMVYIVFMVSAGISSACSIYISEANAAGDFHHAKRIGNLGIICGAAVMSVFALIYLFTPEFVLRPFLSAEELQNSDVVVIAIELLVIAAFLQFFDAWQNIGLGILRGLGDVKSTLMLSLIGYWCIGLPGAWLFQEFFSLGILGVWYALMLGLAVTALSEIWLFNHRANRLLEPTSLKEQNA
ncbi:MATE family efflux transporter [Pseudoalteromonas sp. A22]|uniref:MATE family efflux transporter n=1 Tax=Pseudoalteromonas sp. A22 TaxID=327511 RepID=UPI001BA7AA9F|nr:MATE family efflux transporter [Pseudoalteromonas sp. A22]QUI63967.1 MATE family efflux transporter [Pseudoalteromonas sp. A22]